MKRILSTAAAMAAAATAVHAGGVERSTQSVAILFEQGRYAELSFGHFSPDVSGSVGGGALSSGDMSSSYNTFSLGYKMDLGDRMALAVILDQPIGADVAYPNGTGYPLQGTTADLSSTAVTALLRYRFDNNVSVYGGLRAQSVKGTVNIRFPAIGLANYGMETSRELDFGYVVGVAWEKPEIAARVALTYNSAITHNLDSTETGLAAIPLTGSFETEVPQSVNLEFQTGIAKDTLLFGSIRWVEWSAFVIDPPFYPAPLGNLVDYESDRITYNLGVGRRFNENWSAAVTLGYEEADGEVTGNLGPTDGFASIGLAATYTMDNVKITGGIRYVDIGDATTSIGANFEGNSGVGVGIRIGYTF
ncbi:MAG: outer membrane protein transport protein [Tabrizicola sp.]|jgi:long-subunit fatty acid transport protein|nr:outer membrane protein transport protein [Tabrizicola sp.]